MMDENDRYAYATRAHAPANEGHTWPPLCGLASASQNPLDSEPITRTIPEFREIPEDSRCWECTAILS
jgi:hypothetical protein